MIDFSVSKIPVEYTDAVDFMKKKADAVARGNSHELLWFLEHNDVITRGLNATDNELLDARFPVVRSDRGGKFTYHGRGQCVVYVILDMRNRKIGVNDLVYGLEEWIIKAMAEININASRASFGHGVFVGNEKIAFIGLRVRKNVSYHGISINVCPHLDNFSSIIPCGLRDVKITSLEKLGKKITVAEMSDILIKSSKDIAIFR